MGSLPLPSGASLPAGTLQRQSTVGDRIHAVRSAAGLVLSSPEKLQFINAMADSALASFLIIQVRHLACFSTFCHLSGRSYRWFLSGTRGDADKQIKTRRAGMMALTDLLSDDMISAVRLWLRFLAVLPNLCNWLCGALHTSLHS